MTSLPHIEREDARAAPELTAPPPRPRRYLTLPMLHFIAAFFPSTVLPPDLRYLSRTNAGAEEAPRGSAAGPSAAGRGSPRLSPASASGSPSRPFPRPSAAPASVVQKALQEEKPPVSVPLAFIAATPQCRRARELHGCVLPPQGGVVLRLLAPSSLFATPEAQLASLNGERDGDGGVGGGGGAMAGGRLDDGYQGLGVSSLPASLYFTKRGHWFYDGRRSAGGPAAQRHQLYTQTDAFTSATQDETGSLLPLVIPASSPGAVLLVIARNANDVGNSNINSNNSNTNGTAPESPIPRPRSPPPRASPVAATMASPTMRRSPGLLPVYGARAPSSSSPTQATPPSQNASPLHMSGVTTSVDAQGFSIGARAQSPPPPQPSGHRASGTPTSASAPPEPRMTASMKALALSSWWLHRTPSLSLSLSLQGFTTEQTLHMMSLLAQPTKSDKTTPTHAVAPPPMTKRRASNPAAEATARRPPNVNPPTTTTTAEGPRRLPPVWSAHSLHTRASGTHKLDECAASLSDETDSSSYTQSDGDQEEADVEGASEGGGHAGNKGTEAPRPKLSADPASRARAGVTEITIRGSGGGGWRPADPSPHEAAPAAAIPTDSEALRTLLAQYPELLSLSIHNSSLTGDELKDVSRDCRRVTHLSLGMNPSLNTTRFLAPSVASTATTATLAAAERTKDAGDDVPAGGQGAAPAAVRALSLSSRSSSSRDASFSMDKSDAAARRDARLSPHERRQIALVMRPADVHMGGVHQGVGNLQGEDTDSADVHHRSKHTDPVKTRGTDDDDGAEPGTSPSPVRVSGGGGGYRVDAASLLRELAQSPAMSRDVAREVDEARNVLLATVPEEDDEVVTTDAFEDTNTPSSFTRAAQAGARHWDRPGPPPHHKHRRARHRDPMTRMPSHQASWAATLLELDLSYTAVHTADVAHYLPRLHHLHVLWLEGCRNVVALDWVPQLPCLQELNLSRCDGLLPASLWPLRDCPRLERLSLSRLACVQHVGWLLAPPAPPPAAGVPGLVRAQNAPEQAANAAIQAPAPRRDVVAAAPAAVGPAAAAAEDVAVIGTERFLRQTVDGGVTAFTLLPREPTTTTTAPPPAPAPAITTRQETAAAVPQQSATAASATPLARGLTQLDLSFTGVTRDGLGAVRLFPYLTSLSLHGCRSLQDLSTRANPNNNNVNSRPNTETAAGAVTAAAPAGAAATVTAARVVGEALLPLRWLAALDLSRTGVRDETLTALIPHLRTTLHTLLLGGCRELTKPPAWLLPNEGVWPATPRFGEAKGSARPRFPPADGPESAGLYGIDMPDCAALTPSSFGVDCVFSAPRHSAAGAGRRQRHRQNHASDDEAPGGDHPDLDTAQRSNNRAGSNEEVGADEDDGVEAYYPNGVTLVRLRGCDRVQDVSGLAALCWVTELDLYHTAVTSETLVPALRRWQCLQTLTLASTSVTDFSAWLPTATASDSEDADTTTSTAAPPFLSTLQHLDLSNTPVTSEGMRFIAHCPQLTTLWLRRCRKITDVRFLRLAGGAAAASDSALQTTGCRTALQELILTEATALASDAVSCISAWATRLRRLVLSNCGGLTALADLRTLATTTLQDLDLSGSVVDETQVRALFGLPQAASALASNTPPQQAENAALAASRSPVLMAQPPPTHRTPTKPTQPHTSSPSPRRLSLTPTTQLTEKDEHEEEKEKKITAPPRSSMHDTTTTTAVGSPVSSSAPPALQVLRLRGCRPLSAQIKTLLTPPTLQQMGFLYIEKVVL